MGELTMNTVKTGGVQMVPVDGRFHVWTKRIGAGPATMLTLHGGPGSTHEYFECFEDFLPPAGIQLIYYDQLGSAYSDQPDEPSLWTVERFREEVEQVRAALGLNQFYLYGHSWGGMLALEYALKYQEYLKGLVISNMTASIPSYVTYINELRRQLPAESLRILERYEANGEYTAPEYEKVMIGEIYSKHLCRLTPWPEPVVRMFRHMNQKVYNTMQGPNEFVVTGTFKDWDRWADLKSINVPTLLSVGRFDTMNVADIERMGSLIPNARVAICENGSHCSMYDDQERYFEGLLRFVKDVEAGEFAA
jgi:proline iminopeptidase